MDSIIYAHEHVTIDLSGVKNDMDCRLSDRELALSQFRRLKKRNVSAVIDQTCRGMGRNAAYTAEIGLETGIEIRHATGFYKEPFLPEECYILDENQLKGIFIKEIEESIGDTGVKASFIGEIGSGKDAITPVEEKIFAAACMAHNECGAPICTHTTLGNLGLEQIALFQKHGVNLQKVVLSHIDLSGDVDYMLRLLDTGVNIAFDTIGKNNYRPDTDRARWLGELCAKGYSGQIVVSMDITRRSNCLALGYNYLVDSFLPMLMAGGDFKPEWLSRILFKNPAAIYGI